MSAESVYLSSCTSAGGDMFFTILFGLFAVVLILYTIFSRPKIVTGILALFTTLQTASFALRFAISQGGGNVPMFAASIALYSIGTILVIRALYRLYTAWCAITTSVMPLPKVFRFSEHSRFTVVYSLTISGLIAVTASGAANLSNPGNYGRVALQVTSCIMLAMLVGIYIILSLTFNWVAKNRHEVQPPVTKEEESSVPTVQSSLITTRIYHPSVKMESTMSPSHDLIYKVCQESRLNRC